MKNTFIYQGLIIIVLTLTSSGKTFAQENKEFIISGRIAGIGNTKVLLGNKPKGGYSAGFNIRYSDSCFSKDDHFTFKGHVDEPSFFSIEVPGVARGWIPFIIENKKIQITGNKDSIYNSIVSGSSQNDIYDHYRENIYSPLVRKAARIYDDIEKLKKINDTAAVKRLENEATAIYNKEIAVSRLRFIEENLDNYGSLHELSISHEDTDSIKKYYVKLSAELKSSTLGKNMRYRLFEYPELIRLKKPMPHFSLPDSANRTWSIADFHGKYVLLDFWASWCGPCLDELPEVKRIDSLYRSKGLQVIGISLDTKRKLWTESIIYHKIPWTNLSDLEGADSKVAVLLNVTAIPSKFLLDPDGNILLMHTSLSEIEKLLSNTLSN